MKSPYLLLILLLILNSGFSQNQGFSVEGSNSLAIKQEKLSEAKVLSDVIPDYPSQWILSCKGTELWASIDGHTLSAKSTDENLSPEQKRILNSIDPGSELLIKMAYTTKNSISNAIEKNTMNFKARITPELEAEYPGGKEPMNRYFKENTYDKIIRINTQNFPLVNVKFTINENGEVGDVEITKRSQDPTTDQLILDAVNKMPRWKPAENSKGQKVKQTFNLGIGNRPAGC